MVIKFHADPKKPMFGDRHQLSRSTPYGYLFMAVLCIAVGYIRLSMAEQEGKEEARPATMEMSLEAE